jgi:hypothetical protein
MQNGVSMAGNMRSFFNDERGITDGTLDAFDVQLEGNTAQLPYTSGIKGRKHAADGTRSFWFIEGDAQGLFLSPPAPGADMAFLVEGESDAMRLWQELGGEFPVAAISGTNGWNESLAECFADYDTVWVILDNDTDYKVVSIVDETWRQIREDLGGKAERVQLTGLPIPVKDICEFFDSYDLAMLRQIAASPRGSSSFRSLDLSKPAPETDWLVQNLIAKHDVTMFIGEPQVGKSWLTMALAVAVANNGDSYLGRAVNHHGRVLYIDEENPEDVVRQRLKKLGLSNGAHDNLRYIHQQSVRLDRHPERLIDEAADYSPDLILLDSLTRLHSGDENNAGFIAGLFNDGINPLVRETGAALVILHHVNKSDGTSAFGRARGSSDIVGSIDAGFDVSKVGHHLHIKPFKSRRVATQGMMAAELLDNPQGGVDLVARNKTVF